MKQAFPINCISLCALACIAVMASLVMPVLHAAQTSTSGTSQSASAKHEQAQHIATPPQSDGERIFQRNCARCHSAPEGFSPRISGTIVRHMRVRANLSQQDAQELLRFFNP